MAGFARIVFIPLMFCSFGNYSYRVIYTVNCFVPLVTDRAILCNFFMFLFLTEKKSTAPSHKFGIDLFLT